MSCNNPWNIDCPQLQKDENLVTWLEKIKRFLDGKGNVDSDLTMGQVFHMKEALDRAIQRIKG